MIPGDILSACPHRQFHTLPGLLDSRVALPNSYPNVLRAMQGGSLYHFYDGLWYDPAGRGGHATDWANRHGRIFFGGGGHYMYALIIWNKVFIIINKMMKIIIQTLNFS